ncbi:MAG: iso-1-cytochrome c [Marteilia pararefringens]
MYIRKILKILIPGALFSCFAGISLFDPVYANQMRARPVYAKWEDNKPWMSFDYFSIRRGLEVYVNVCHACHELTGVCFYHFINRFLTEDEANDLAKNYTITDGPDDTGEMFTRKRKVIEGFPKPYKNIEEGKHVNNGNYPPNLAFIINGRPEGTDYVFSLLTGYCDPIAGVKVEEGNYFNPYKDGGVIGMAPPLYDDIIEYQDGTVASASQCAKDVTSFLTYVGMMPRDEFRIGALYSVYLFVPLFIALMCRKFFIFRSFKAMKAFQVPIKRRFK